MAARVVELAGLYVSEKGRLGRLINRIVGNSATAEDLVQDTFVNVLGAPQSREIRDDKAYLSQVARNLAIDHTRKDRRLVDLKEEDFFALVDPSPSPRPSRQIARHWRSPCKPWRIFRSARARPWKCTVSATTPWRRSASSSAFRRRSQDGSCSTATVWFAIACGKLARSRLRRSWKSAGLLRHSLEGTCSGCISSSAGRANRRPAHAVTMSDNNDDLWNEAMALLLRWQAAPDDAELRAEIVSFCAQSEAHHAAWDGAKRLYRLTGEATGAETPEQKRKKSRDVTRRKVLTGVGALVAGAGALEGPGLWRRWNADLVSDIGRIDERRLPDGSRITLGPDTARPGRVLAQVQAGQSDRGHGPVRCRGRRKPALPGTDGQSHRDGGHWHVVRAQAERWPLPRRDRQRQNFCRRRRRLRQRPRERRVARHGERRRWQPQRPSRSRSGCSVASLSTCSRSGSHRWAGR